MAKRKAAKDETKSEFLRRVLGKDPNLEYRQVNPLWSKAGHEGEISSALFYQVRSKMGIKTSWGWARIADVGDESIAGHARPATGGSSRSRAAKAASAVYQLKVTLGDIRPPIWRRLLVPDCSLAELHEVIQVAMGWANYHLYSFDVGAESYTDPEGAADLDMGRADRARLSDIIPGAKFKFRYNYDFGDNWDHVILVEKVLPPEDGERYPTCLDGKRACPPEDVGGPWGYEEYLEAIRNPKHERHDELLEWGGEFDPEAFDPEEVNGELRLLR